MKRKRKSTAAAKPARKKIKIVHLAMPVYSSLPCLIDAGQTADSDPWSDMGEFIGSTLVVDSWPGRLHESGQAGLKKLKLHKTFQVEPHQFDDAEDCDMAKINQATSAIVAAPHPFKPQTFEELSES